MSSELDLYLYWKYIERRRVIHSYQFGNQLFHQEVLYLPRKSIVENSYTRHILRDSSLGSQDSFSGFLDNFLLLQTVHTWLNNWEIKSSFMLFFITVLYSLQYSKYVCISISNSVWTGCLIYFTLFYLTYVLLPNMLELMCCYFKLSERTPQNDRCPQKSCQSELNRVCCLFDTFALPNLNMKYPTYHMVRV